MKLYEISANFAEVFDAMDSLAENKANGKDISTEDTLQSLTEVLESMNVEFDAKAEAVALYIKELKAQTFAMKAEEKRLAERRKSKESQVEWLTDYIKRCMENAQKKKVETPRCVLSIRRNPESVEISDPPRFIEMLQENGRDDLLKYAEPEIRKSEIKKLMKQGEVFQGAQLVTRNSLLIQ